MSHESWGRAPDITTTQWIDDDVARFVPANVAIPDTERKAKNRNAWTFGQAAASALTSLAEDKVALRIAGPSGFGKSRFVYELFNRNEITADEIENAVVIYADLSIVGDEVSQLALDLADSGSPAILIVDECRDETHNKLVGLAGRTGSCLRLVTIDIETKIVEAEETLTIRLAPASDQMIGNIAKSVVPGLRDSEMRLIQELSHGFPQMAVLGARVKGHGRRTLASSEQLLDRIIWGRNAGNDTAQKALEFLSLFDWVGLTERTGNGVAFIAGEFAGMQEDIFVEHVKSFKPRGIIEQRGDYIRVTPIPLAVCLGGRRLSLLPDGKLRAFFAEAPPELKNSLLRRFRWLDTVPEARQFAQTLLSPENLGHIDALKTDFGAECLDRLVHVDPDTAMATMDRVFGSLTTEDLSTVKDGRRHLVWALEKLVFRKQSFDRAASLLRRFAAAETEDHISNNASGQFKQLYQLYLSGTEADPAARLLVLDDGLRSSNPKERELCVEALGHMLDVNHFSRGGGAEEIGSDRLKDWQPTTYGEIRDFIRAAVTRLTDIALADDPLSSRAKEHLGSHVRTLINRLPLDEVAAMIGRIVTHCGFWPEALQGVNYWLYFDRKGYPEDIGQNVRTYFDELMPTDPVELVVLYTHGWQADLHDPDVNYDPEDKDYKYSMRKSMELAQIIAEDPAMIERAVSRLVTSDAKTVFPFTKRLAELVPAPVELFKTALACADASSETANRGFFCGLIEGIDNRDPATARACIRECLRSWQLKSDVISMIGSGRLEPKDIDLVVSLLKAGDVQPWQCASLSYGRGMDHLSAEAMLPLLDELIAHGAEGLWTALDIITMVLHGNQRSPQPFFATIRSVLLDRALFDRTVRGSRDGYRLEEITKLLVKHDAIDEKFARALAKQLFSVCERRNSEISLALSDPVRVALQSLIETHPKAIWTEASRLFLKNDPIVQIHFKYLIEAPPENHLCSGLFYNLPAELYLDWVRKDPSRRASIVLEWMPITIETDDGLSWHPELEAFIQEFGTADHVLEELSDRFFPRSSSGSLVPYIEPLISLIEMWASHPLPEVRHWASRQTVNIRNWVMQEQQRDEENMVRYA